MSYKGRFIRNAALMGLMTLGVTATAFGQTSAATTLGPLWQNAADVSRNSDWHVYATVLNGIKYIQVRDRAGTLHTVIGVVNGTPFVTPMGVDALRVSVPSPSAAPSTTSAAAIPQTIYSDGTTTVTAAPQSNGAMSFAVMDICKTTNCGGGG